MTAGEHVLAGKIPARSICKMLMKNLCVSVPPVGCTFMVLTKGKVESLGAAEQCRERRLRA